MPKHLEMQNEMLSESHPSISHDLQRLKVEEEMLMRKLYELLEAEALTKKNENSDKLSIALVGPICNEDRETGNSTALFCAQSKGQTIITNLSLDVSLVNVVNQIGYC